MLSEGQVFKVLIKNKDAMAEAFPSRPCFICLMEMGGIEPPSEYDRAGNCYGRS